MRIKRKFKALAFITAIICMFSALSLNGAAAGSKPSTVSNLSVYTDGSGETVVSWGAAANADYYRVERSKFVNGTYEVMEEKYKDTTYIINDNGDYPYWRITAVNSVGESIGIKQTGRPYLNEEYRFKTEYPAYDAAMYGEYLYVAEGTEGIGIYTCEGDLPERIGSFAKKDGLSFHKICAYKDYIFVACYMNKVSQASFQIYSVENPEAPLFIGGQLYKSKIYDMQIKENALYIRAGGMNVYDISFPEKLTVKFSSDSVLSMTEYNGIYLLGESRHLKTVDLGNPKSMMLYDSIDLYSSYEKSGGVDTYTPSIKGIAVKDNYAVLFNNYWPRVVDISTPRNIVFKGDLSFGRGQLFSSAYSIQAGSFAFVLDENRHTVRVYNVAALADRLITLEALYYNAYANNISYNNGKFIVSIGESGIVVLNHYRT